MKFNSLNVFDMITNEMKAKIAAMYLGCEVQTPDGIGSFWSVGTDGWIYAKCEGMQSEEYRCDEYQLILTPLSEITDEDARKVLSIIWQDNRYRSVCNAEHVVTNLDHTSFPASISIEIADFLRSKGYALPYMGIDLFKSGIAIPNNKTK